MELMLEADHIVRYWIPAVLDSTGEEEEARRLRSHSKLNNKTAKSICRLLSTVCVSHLSLRHLIFWTEALVRAAMRKDPASFSLYVDKIAKMLNNEIIRKKLLN